MMHAYSHKRLKQQHSRSSVVFFGFWIALIIPMLAWVVSFSQSPAPLMTLAGGNIQQVAGENLEYANLVGYPKEIATPVNQIQLMERIAMLHPDQATRAQAIADLSQLRKEWSETIGVPLTDMSAYATAAQNQNKVVMAVGRDLYVSNDGGQTFEQRVGVLPSQVNTLAISPANEAILYAGVDGMGFYTSENDGLTWTPANTGIAVSPGARFGITAITINPNNAQNMYIAAGVWMGTSQVTWYPLGVLETKDGGASWTKLETDTNTPIQFLFLDGNTLYTIGNGQQASYHVNNLLQSSED